MTTDERIDAITAKLEVLAQLHIDSERKRDEWQEEWERRAIAADDRAAEAEQRHDREIAAIRAELRHAARLAIQEAQAERRKRRELDEKITQLAAAQLVTEEKQQRTEEMLQRFLEGRSTNGKP
jgi:hypothetical protein